MTLTFNPQTATETHDQYTSKKSKSNIKVKGQLVRKTEWKQTDTTDFITFLVNATGNYVRPDVGLFQQSYVWQGDLADNSQMSRLKSSLGDAFVRFFVRMAPAKAM